MSKELMRLVLRKGIQNVVVHESNTTGGTCVACREYGSVRLTKLEYEPGVNSDWCLTCIGCHAGCDVDDISGELADSILILRGAQ